MFSRSDGPVAGNLIESGDPFENPDVLDRTNYLSRTYENPILTNWLKVFEAKVV